MTARIKAGKPSNLKAKRRQGPQGQTVDLEPISDELAAIKFESLIVRSANLARKQAAKSGRRVALADLIQAGWLAFFTAKRKWNPERGVTLGAYCSIWVRGAISREIWNGREVWEESHGKYGRITVPSQDLSQITAIESFLDGSDALTRYVVDAVLVRNLRPELIAMRKRMLIGDVLAILSECLDWSRSGQ